MSYKCPKCGGTDFRVEVAFVMSMDGDDGVLEFADNHAPENIDEVTGYPTTLCVGCDYTAPLNEFDAEALPGDKTEPYVAVVLHNLIELAAPHFTDETQMLALAEARVVLDSIRRTGKLP